MATSTGCSRLIKQYTFLSTSIRNTNISHQGRKRITLQLCQNHQQSINLEMHAFYYEHTFLLSRTHRSIFSPKIHEEPEGQTFLSEPHSAVSCFVNLGPLSEPAFPIAYKKVPFKTHRKTVSFPQCADNLKMFNEQHNAVMFDKNLTFRYSDISQLSNLLRPQISSPTLELPLQHVGIQC